MIVLALLLAANTMAALPRESQCVKKLPDGGYDEPDSFQELRDCQLQMGSDADLSGKKTDAFEAAQRAEARDYLSRHTISGSGESSKAGQDSPNRSLGKADAADEKDLSQIDPKIAAKLKILQQTIQDESQGGKLGVTKQMSAQILDFLSEAQNGQISPDMRDLVNSAAADGPNLTKSTVDKLSAAAKEAKEEGLDLPAGSEPLLQQNQPQGQSSPPSRPSL